MESMCPLDRYSTPGPIRDLPSEKPIVLRTRHDLLHYLRRFNAIVYIGGFGGREQYEDVDTVARQVAVHLFEAPQSLDKCFGKGKWAACFGGHTLNKSKPDVAALVARLQEQHEMTVVAFQCQKVEQELGGVDNHIDAVHYYPTVYRSDGKTVAWGGFDGERPVGTTRVILDIIPCCCRPMYFIAAGGDGLVRDEIQAAWRRGMGVLCIKANAKSPQDPAMPAGPCTTFWDRLNGVGTTSEGAYGFRHQPLATVGMSGTIVVPEPVWCPKYGQKKILVTGGSGLLGRPLLFELVERGFAVVNVSSKPFQFQHPMIQTLFAFLEVRNIHIDLKLDVGDGLPKLIEVIDGIGFDLVMNLAADRGGIKWDGKAMKMNDQTLNTQLPARLLEVCHSRGLPLFLLSTEYVWSGADNSDVGYPPLEVGDDPRFLPEGIGSPYGQQKRQVEANVKAHGSELVTIIRLPVLYGKMLNSLEDGTAGQSIANFLAENTWSHDTWQKRYPTCAEDSAFALAALATKRLRCGLDHRLYHYGGQGSVSKFEFIQMFAQTIGVDVNLIKKESAGDRPKERQPPFDVKLSIVEIRDELSRVNDWKEPRLLDTCAVRRYWLPHFRQEAIRMSGKEL